jgi:hypothetical protein
VSTDFPGDGGLSEPSLDCLVRALTAGPTADELVAEDAALARFRSSARRPSRRLPYARRAALATVAVAVTLVGSTAAAYAAVLPAPVQHVAHRFLDRIGVPGVHRVHRVHPDVGRHAHDVRHARHVPGVQHAALSPEVAGQRDHLQSTLTKIIAQLADVTPVDQPASVSGQDSR